MYLSRLTALQAGAASAGASTVLALPASRLAGEDTVVTMEARDAFSNLVVRGPGDDTFTDTTDVFELVLRSASDPSSVRLNRTYPLSRSTGITRVRSSNESPDACRRLRRSRMFMTMEAGSMEWTIELQQRLCDDPHSPLQLSVSLVLCVQVHWLSLSTWDR